MPNSVSEEEYKYIREYKDEDKALTEFVGFGCSFASKWFGRYARGHGGKLGYADAAKRSLLKKMSTMQDIIFDFADYKTLSFSGCLVYCDPSYDNTTKFTGTPDFDTEEFGDVMWKWSKNNDGYLSEYISPDDFECILEIPTRIDIRNKNNQMEKRVEKLFKYKAK